MRKAEAATFELQTKGKGVEHFVEASSQREWLRVRLSHGPKQLTTPNCPQPTAADNRQLSIEFGTPRTSARKTQ